MSTTANTHLPYHAILTLSRIGLRVSIEVLSFTSPVFKRLLAEAQPLPSNDDPEGKPTKLLTLTDDPGNSLCTLLNVLHLRNDALPTRMSPIELSRFVEMAAKYSCIPAACRATSPWLDYIYTRHDDPPLYQMVKAAYVLGDATYFARFSSRWVLNEPLSQQNTPTIPMTPPYRNLSRALLQRQKDGLLGLRVDLEDMISPLGDAFAKEYSHFVDSPPGDDAVPVELGGDPDPERCVVDKEGAALFFGALRDAKIWPANSWPQTNLVAVTEALVKLQIPDHDTSDGCHFCAGVRVEFTDAVNELRQEQKDRLWGLCLDCFKAGRARTENEECAYEHDKPAAELWPVKQMGDPSGYPKW